MTPTALAVFSGMDLHFLDDVKYIGKPMKSLQIEQRKVPPHQSHQGKNISAGKWLGQARLPGYYDATLRVQLVLTGVSVR